jgi:glycosyltransferase involved in cell wall biosynthesis
MAKVSVFIPARHEIYLQNTIDEVLSKARGEIECIVVLDGYWPIPQLREDPKVTVIHTDPKGMRSAINTGADFASGEFLMKLDAHCILSEGYDLALQAECDKDWMVIPRRYSLETDSVPWGVRLHRAFTDYEYLIWPWQERLRTVGLIGRVWDQRTQDRIDKLLDENLTFQGSCWFVRKDYFQKCIGHLSETGYGTFVCEAQELGMKVWLSGGKVMTNKKVWYAHLWKGKPYRDAFRALYGFGYTRVGNTEWKKGNAFNAKYWLSNKWEERIHDIEWLLEKFWPLPGWPEKWKEAMREHA